MFDSSRRKSLITKGRVLSLSPMDVRSGLSDLQFGLRGSHRLAL